MRRRARHGSCWREWAPKHRSLLLPAFAQIGYAVPIQWWLVFLPQWIGHAGHAALVVFVLSSVVSRRQQDRGWWAVLAGTGPCCASSSSPCAVCASWTWSSSCALLHVAVALHTPLTRQSVVLLTVQDKLVRQQLGPAPPATASPGMILQYNTMFSERKRSLFIDNVNGLIESAAALLVKVRADGRPVVCLRPAAAPPCSMHTWDGHAGSWLVPGVLQALSTQPGLRSDNAQACAVADVLRAPSATCVLP